MPSVPLTEPTSLWVVASFYHFTVIKNPVRWQKPLMDYCKAHGMKGTILLAKEGINATICGSPFTIEKFFVWLKRHPLCKNITYKVTHHAISPFERMKVRVKREIVTMGIPDINVVKNRGTYVKPTDWDALLKKEDILVIDTRNIYETSIGTFENALVPPLEHFRHFPKWAREHLPSDKKRPIAMFCTGGIRCEKSTAFLKENGHEEVYHLEGGILAYLEQTKNHEKKWKGTCFVFDDRVTLNDSLTACPVTCSKCRISLSTEAIKHYAYAEEKPEGNIKKTYCKNCSPDSTL